MILGAEVDAHALPHAARLVLLEIIFATTITPIVMKDEAVMIAATRENVPSLHDPVADFLPPKVAHMGCQTIEHLWSADRPMVTPNAFPLRRVL